MKIRSVEIDKIDLLFYIGLLMLGGGLAMKALWISLCVVGSVLVIVSTMGALRK